VRLLHDVPMPGLRHITLSASTFARSLAFYDAALAALGLDRAQEFGDEEEEDPAVEAAGYGPADRAPVFWLVAGPTPTRGAHLAFAAGSRDEVEAFFAAAVAAGGTPRQAPRRWEIYRPGYYGAVVADPDGNLVEAAIEE
jgi:catechol 2,3-dioxygenase-like lactoylglutathione lyase family enzyme